jgi:hypothetical protein
MYECPNCNGNLKFDISSQKLLCAYCGTMMDPYDFQKDHDAEETVVGEEEYEVTVFTCPQCGGELISNDTTAATFCSFCGGSTILDSRISREKRPDYIIPFQKTREDCEKAYVKMLRHVPFVPNELKDKGHIARFRSIYMPYWVYTFEKSEHVAFQGSQTHRRGDYIITKYYTLESDVEAEYKGLAFDAAASFSDSLSNAIAPFEWKEAKPFTPAFLSGFYADTDDVAAVVYQEDAQAIVKQELCNRMESDSQCRKYELKDSFVKAMTPRMTQKDLAMFPVWFLTYRNKDRVSYAVVNGQTGKVAGDIPVDRNKYLRGTFLLALPVFLLLNLLVSMKASTMLIVTGFLATLCCVISCIQKKELQTREVDADDKGKWYPVSPGETAKIKVSVSREVTSYLWGILFATIMITFMAVFHSLSDSSGATFFCVLVWLVLPMLFRFGKKTRIRTERKVNNLTWRDFWDTVKKPGMGIVIAIVVTLLHPVSDLFYYGAALVAMGLITWDILGMIERHNQLASRVLPQFSKRGGEEDGR